MSEWAADLSEAFERWSDLAELQIEFVEVLGEHKLQAAKSDLVRAVTAQHWAVARIKAALARELEVTLRRLRRFRYQSKQHIERLQRQAQAAAKIRSGEDILPTQLTLMWASYTVFERLVPVPVVEEIIATELAEDAWDGSSYAHPGNNTQETPGPPEEIDNLHALMSWLKQQRLVPRRGTAVYGQVVGAFARLASFADSEIDSLRKMRKSLEQETFDIWQPLPLVAMPDNLDVEKIIRAGIK